MNKTNHRGSSLPRLAVYNLDGVIVASSYKRHASGQVEFWHIRNQKVFTMPIKQFNDQYITK